MSTIERINALEYIASLIEKHNKLLAENEKILCSKHLVCSDTASESIQKKIDDINVILGHLEYIKTVLEDKEDKGVKDTLESKVKDADTKVDTILSKPKKEKSNKGKHTPVSLETLRIIYPKYPDDLLTQLLHTEHDVIEKQIINFIGSSNVSVNVNDILGNIYETLKIITKRDRVLSICSELYINKIVDKGKSPGFYKKIHT